ncbi:MAG: adenylate/guanylate cyclase domain-containing protein [Anaerolineae bacterium]|nr:adenylate/guanylate cyclase domain-containing protein [Anaerolineae bacterium]
MDLSGGQFLLSEPGGIAELELSPNPTGWPEDEPIISLTPSLTLANPFDRTHLFILERMTWSDQSLLAAEVIMLQQFRDLFSREALRPGEQISVGTLAIVFTDLRDSTRLYQQIGDAPAFGRVMEHFDVLKQAIAEQDGSIVKTIGDAVMAVFRTPTEALRAMLSAQIALDNAFKGALSLKAGIHYGHAIAVTLNERLDYFGSTINLAARLEKYSDGEDLILSNSVYEDPEIQDFFFDNKTILKTEPVAVQLKGFDEEIQLWRVRKVT